MDNVIPGGGVAKIASVHMDPVDACARGGGGSMVRWHVALAMLFRMSSSFIRFIEVPRTAAGFVARRAGVAVARC